MAKKKIYIYRLEAGYGNKDPEMIGFFYASNSKKLIEYVQQLYKDKKYSKFTTVKVGVTSEPEKMRKISEFEDWYLRQYAKDGNYSERIEP